MDIKRVARKKWVNKTCYSHVILLIFYVCGMADCVHLLADGDVAIVGLNGVYKVLLYFLSGGAGTQVKERVEG